MNKGAKKDSLLLVTAGAAFIAANLVVYMGVRSGQIAPVDNTMLWGAFSVLSICSLLWAVSMLGLQPIVVAVSYAAGGFMAYQGVRLTPEVNVAEIATAGATFGAFGALVVGNATAKVRLAFFAKRQVPFVAIILVLLLVDGVLNSRVSNAGWHVIANAVVLPFLFCGVIVGLVWRLISKRGPARKKNVKISESLEEAEKPAPVAMENENAVELKFSVPEGAGAAVIAENEASIPDIDLEAAPAPAMAAAVSPPPKEGPDRDQVLSDSFFPLDIDEGEDQRIEENPELMGLAERVAKSAPEPIVAATPEPTEYSAPEPIGETAPEPTDYSVPEPALESAIEPVAYNPPEPPAEDIVFPTPESSAATEETTPEDSVGLETPATGEEPVSEEGKSGSEDWLDSHLDLLNKLK
jgi:hypothetical protein